MTKSQIIKSWIWANLIASAIITTIILLANLFLDQIEMDFSRFIQVLIGIVLFYIFGSILTFHHFIYSLSLIRKNIEKQKCWKKITLTMIVPYLLLITLVISTNVLIYRNPIFEIPNLLFLGILIIHVIVGILVWRYFWRKMDCPVKDKSKDKLLT